ncbi:MAG: DEAD/DEAH box helicase [Ferruginibacter sp.]
MATQTTVSKTALLFSPMHLTSRKEVLRSIHINKANGITKYDITALDDTAIRKQLGEQPKQVKDAVHGLTEDALTKIEDEIIRKHKAQKSGVPLRQFLIPAYTRRLVQQLETLKPFFPLLKWYHQAPNPATGNLMIAPCTFSTFKTQLKFEVISEDGLQLVTWVTINSIAYKIEDFRRFHFLLESRNEYFFLAFKDYQTIEWLQHNNTGNYANDPNAFAQNILSKLEDDYEVERNNLFAVSTIEVIPIHRVLLSEISNAFLVFTPQWLYDGHLIEGNWKENYETTVQGNAIIVKRNKEAETGFKKQLESLHANFPKQLNGYYHISFAEAQKKQWFLKIYHQLLDMNIELVGIDMLSHFRYSPHKPVTTIEILKKDTNTLTIHFNLQFAEETVALSELQKILIAGQRAVMLKDGSLGVFSEAWLAEYATIVKHSKILNKKELQVPQWLAVTEQEKEAGNHLKITVSEGWWEKWQRWQQPEGIIYAIPQTVQATLRPYQQKGFEWMKMMAEISAGACLADDMGLGKTLQTICFVADRLHQNSNGLALIICPSSLIYNWQKEFGKFTPKLRVYVHHGATRDINNISNAQYDVIITSYGTLRSDVEALAAIVFDTAVVDESHNIKNPAAQITKAVNQLQAISRVTLSGTPVMNNTFDLYSQLEFLLPGMFGSREFFKREYADPIDRDRNEEKIWMLQKLTAPFILRRTKEQVAKDLPEKTESILWCSMSNAQKSMYDEIRDSIKSNLFLNIKNEGIGKSKLAVLQGIMKLKQVCSSPLLLPKEEQTTDESVKTTVLLDEIVNLGDHKVLVFSQFSSMLHLLADTLAKKKIQFYLLEGSTAPKQRAAMVDSFQEPGNKTNIFLISLMAGNTGLTLTAADYVFLFDPWWNNAVQQQAIDRTHRIGQTKKVFAYKMICKDSIEEKIIQLQQAKKELSENLIGDTEGFVKELTKEDVEFLFS